MLAASIFHYREYTIREAKEYMAARGIPVRLEGLVRDTSSAGLGSKV